MSFGQRRARTRRLPGRLSLVAAVAALLWPAAAHGAARGPGPFPVSPPPQRAHTAAGAPDGPGAKPPDDRPALLAVPYVPQEELLCGGAAAAMVARYWGVRQAATDYARLVDPNRHGIPTVALVDALRQDGWYAMPFSGTASAVEDHLEAGRPVIALLEVGPNRYHYVVIVAWIDGQVVLHDPAVEPYRVLPEAEFERAWVATNRWSLLVLPGTRVSPAAGPVEAAVEEKPAIDDSQLRTMTLVAGGLQAADVCTPLLRSGIDAVRTGDLTAAEARLQVALAACPRSAAAARELAGLRFRQERWQEAVRLARRALELAPDDRYTRRLLASARFLAGDRDGALDVWNALQEPRIDLTEVRGQTRTRYPVILQMTDLHAGELLTRERLVHARRRLSELPTAGLTRLRYEPPQDGSATVVAAVVERPLLPTSPLLIGAAAARAAVEDEASLQLASPTGGGVAWTPWWRWGDGRSGVGLSVALPAPSGIGAVWRLDVYRQEGIFGVGAAAARPPGFPESREVPGWMADAPDGLARSGRIQRTRVGLTIADWFGPDIRWEVGSGWDRWQQRGQHLFVGVGLERRLAGDRLAVRMNTTVWTPDAAASAFAEGGASATWRSTTEKTIAPEGWHGVAGVQAVGGDAPLDLWPGAGQGELREPLLRAHPLVENGAIRPDGVGRSLLYGTLEYCRPLTRLGPVGLSGALFTDMARISQPASPTAPGHSSGLAIDVGAGLRVRLPGQPGILRLDVAHGVRDGVTSFSTGWLIDWER